MPAVATRHHRPRLESVEEPMRSCECGEPLVAVLPIDGEPRAICEGCLASYSDLIQTPDAVTDPRGVLLSA